MIFLQLYVAGGQASLSPRYPAFSEGVGTVCVCVCVCGHACTYTVYIGSLLCGRGRACTEPYMCVGRTWVFLCAPCVFGDRHAAGLSVHYLCVIYKHTCYMFT